VHFEEQTHAWAHPWHTRGESVRHV
jgi:hypothetical protein